MTLAVQRDRFTVAINGQPTLAVSDSAYRGVSIGLAGFTSDWPTEAGFDSHLVTAIR